ncbi:hypothetical protein EIP86_009723 [Pleurotus ostreatoroseus]|nr:hypothetical protein EIP86_009723 [Pleurotus ostreatoroseus]
MLNFGLKYRNAIDKFTGDRTNDLRKFELGADEWEIATQLRDVLHKTLDKYYLKTDMSETYRISMILQPHLKLAYFARANWPLEWIQTAEEIFCKKFKKSYASPSPVREDLAAEHQHTESQSTATKKSKNIFNNLELFTLIASSEDKIDLYLKAPCEDVPDCEVLA